MRATGARMLGEARALRLAFPDTNVMHGLPISVLPAGAAQWPNEWCAALGYLLDEMSLVRAGKTDSLAVLNDEIACVERLLSVAPAR